MSILNQRQRWTCRLLSRGERAETRWSIISIFVCPMHGNPIRAVLQYECQSKLQVPLEMQEGHNFSSLLCRRLDNIQQRGCSLNSYDRCNIPRMTKSLDEWIRLATIFWHGKSFVNFSRKLGFAVIVYCIWQERNARIFADVSTFTSWLTGFMVAQAIEL